jgi:membrane protein
MSQQGAVERAGVGESVRSGTDMMTQIWDAVASSPLHDLWNLKGVSIGTIARRTLKSTIDDNLFSRAAELGFYFLFALFPTLVSATAILGLAARSASSIYGSLLQYLTWVLPPSAYSLVIATFNQTAASATTGKVTLGLVAAIWSASVGFSSIQDGMNAVYRVQESRPYWKARGVAILVTAALAFLVTLNLGVLLGGDFCAHLVRAHIWHHALGTAASVAIRTVSGIVACALLLLQLSLIYYCAPDLRQRCWRWNSPGAAFALLGWIVASVGFRAYLHFTNSYTVTYGSLGAVIVLLTWFYLTGLMILLGAEINSEIQAAVVARELKADDPLHG